MDTLHPVAHACVPRYFGPHAGIRCLHCNLPVAPDPRVTETAVRYASPNLEATAAAVNARGEGCRRCGHWTFRPARVVTQGRTPAPEASDGLCRNCAALVPDLTGSRQEAKIWSASRYGGGTPLDIRPEPKLCRGCGEPESKGAHGVNQGFGGCV